MSLQYIRQSFGSVPCKMHRNFFRKALGVFAFHHYAIDPIFNESKVDITHNPYPLQSRIKATTAGSINLAPTDEMLSESLNNGLKFKSNPNMSNIVILGGTANRILTKQVCDSLGMKQGEERGYIHKVNYDKKLITLKYIIIVIDT